MTNTTFPIWILRVVASQGATSIGEFCPRERARLDGLVADGFLVRRVDPCYGTLFELAARGRALI